MPFDQTAKDLFLNHSKKNLVSITTKLNKMSNFFAQNENTEQLYTFLKQIRDGSAIFDFKEIYDTASFLLKQIKIDGLKYNIAVEKQQILLDGLKILTKLLFADSEPDYLFNKRTAINKEDLITILIIDSDTFIVEWLKDSLKDSEFNIVSAGNERIANTILKEQAEIVLLDIDIEANNGFETLNRIREDKWLAAIPAIALTYTLDEQKHLNILNSGFDDIIQKPFSIPMFLAKIRNNIVRKKKDYHSFNIIFNHQREEMKALVKKEWIRFQRFQSFFSLVIVKLDLYQDLIEKHGADVVINYMHQLFNLINGSIRTYDELRSWHANSFILLLPATQLEGAHLVGKRIMGLTGKLEDEFNLGSKVQVGVIESELGYSEPFDMIKRLEKDILTALPLTPLKLQYLFKEEKTDIELKKKKVLIIDDDPIPPTILQNHLKTDEWDIEVCSDGSKALDMVLQFKPNFIISETRTKDLDGFSFCYQLRQFPTLKNTLFFFLSKQTLSKHIIRGFQIGADDYITKPFSPQELEARMRRHWLKRNNRE